MREQAEKVIDVLEGAARPDGLVNTMINHETGKPSNKVVTFGGMGDSFYEYLLKVGQQLCCA